jgi:hypothetical protein
MKPTKPQLQTLPSSPRVALFSEPDIFWCNRKSNRLDQHDITSE